MTSWTLFWLEVKKLESARGGVEYTVSNEVLNRVYLHRNLLIWGIQYTLFGRISGTFQF